MARTVDLTTVPVSGTSAGLTAYVAEPAGQDAVPGVVVIHEAFGLEDVTRRQAEHLAALGYLAIAPDLFSQGGPMRCLRSTFSSLRSGHGRAFQDISAARQWLLGQERCTGAVGIIGFCMGGAFALMCAAPQHEFAVSSVNYGFAPKDLEVLRGACPVVASYGGKDRQLASTADRLRVELGAMGVEVDAKVYPDAGHSFLNDAVTGPWFMRPLAKVTGMGPEPVSAADAWQRIDAFFDRHLRDGEDRADGADRTAPPAP